MCDNFFQDERLSRESIEGFSRSLEITNHFNEALAYELTEVMKKIETDKEEIQNRLYSLEKFIDLAKEIAKDISKLEHF